MFNYESLQMTALALTFGFVMAEEAPGAARGPADPPDAGGTRSLFSLRPRPAFPGQVPVPRRFRASGSAPSRGCLSPFLERYVLFQRAGADPPQSCGIKDVGL